MSNRGSDASENHFFVSFSNPSGICFLSKSIHRAFHEMPDGRACVVVFKEFSNAWGGADAHRFIVREN